MVKTYGNFFPKTENNQNDNECNSMQKSKDKSYYKIIMMLLHIMSDHPLCLFFSYL